MLLAFVILGLPTLVISKCIQCASPSLQSQWQLTGFPRQPGNLPFHSSCETAIQDAPEDMGLTTCSSVCFEMVIPASNNYHFLRGCHDDFIEKGVTQQQVRDAPKCLFTNVTSQKITSLEDPKVTVTAVAAIIFYKDLSDSTGYQNVQLTRSTLEKNPTYIRTKLDCKETQEVNCVKSIYYDGTGEDNNKNSCSGAYCTSFEGKLNGRKYIERGCAPIAPFMDNTCFWLTTNTTFYSGPGNGGSLSREKRSLDAILAGTQCICTSVYCNTTARTSLGMLMATVIVTTVIRFLH